MCSHGSMWWNISKFPKCPYLSGGYCIWSMDKTFPCLRELCKFAKDCAGCINLGELLSNGDDDSNLCERGHSISSDCKPCFPCDKKKLQIDVLNEKYAEVFRNVFIGKPNTGAREDLDKIDEATRRIRENG